MPGCAAVNCTNRPRNDCRLFKFPRDPNRRNKWITNMRRPFWTPGNSTYLCEKHFDESQFEQNRADNWRKLRPYAIPTLFDVPTQSSRTDLSPSKSVYKNSNQTRLVEINSPQPSTRIREAVVQGILYECELDAEQNRNQVIMANIKEEILADDNLFIENDGIELEYAVNLHNDEIKIEETTLQPYIYDSIPGLDDNIEKKESKPLDMCHRIFFDDQSLPMQQIPWTDIVGTPLHLCTLCDEVFNSAVLLETHSKTCTGYKQETAAIDPLQILHSSPKIHRCFVCEEDFDTAENLQKHFRSHPGQVQYGCDVCQKLFTKPARLAIHKRTHTGERPYKCKVCKAKFARKCSLKLHKRTHTGERPFPCDLCERRFSRKHNFLIHRRIHIGDSLYNCGVCAKKFYRRDQWAAHMRIHPDERLGNDAKQVTGDQSLTEDRPAHTRTRPFCCDRCSKKFARKSTLVLHMQMHSGERAYECDFCEKKFMHKKSLVKHQLRHIVRSEVSKDEPLNNN